LEVAHIRFMRRYANLAIKVSEDVLKQEFDSVFAAAVTEVRRDALVAPNRLDERRRSRKRRPKRRPPPKRYAPIAIIRAMVDQMRASYRALFDTDEAIEDVAETEGKLNVSNALRWAANTLAQIAKDPEIPTWVGPQVVATKPQMKTSTRKSWVRRNVDAVVLHSRSASSRAKRFFGRSKSIPEEYFDRVEATLTQGVREAAAEADKAAAKATKAAKAASADPPRRPPPDEPGEPEAPDEPDGFEFDLTVELEVIETQASRDFEAAARATRERLIKERGIARRRARNTQGDSKVRPAHKARSGKIYTWGEPPTEGLAAGQPSDGHPGEAVECRCWAAGNFNEAYKSGQLVARTQAPTPVRRGRQGPIRPEELPANVDPGQIAFRREVFEASISAEQIAQEERDRRFGAGGGP
jgi:hypothetical protein